MHRIGPTYVRRSTRFDQFPFDFFIAIRVEFHGILIAISMMKHFSLTKEKVRSYAVVFYHWEQIRTESPQSVLKRALVKTRSSILVPTKSRVVK